MAKVDAKTRKQLNRLPSLLALNERRHPTEAHASEAFRQLMEEASALGWYILGDNNPRKLDTSTTEHVHPLHKVGTEDEEADNCFLIRQVYFYENDAVEVTAYFS